MLQSAIKAKAPVVAIPLEGHAPFCVDGKRLRAWAKGVTITSQQVVVTGGEWYYVEEPVRYGCMGPNNAIAEQTVVIRWLQIVGHVGKIRTKARFVPIARAEAIKTLSAWSEKERARLEKKTLLGALSKDDKRAMKRAKYEDDGEGMIPLMASIALPDHCVTCGKVASDYPCRSAKHEIQAKREKREEKLGLPVVIPEWAEAKLALVKWGDVETDTISFTVTELISGQRVGTGDTGEAAILDARVKLGKITAEKKAAMLAKLQFDWAMMEAHRMAS